VRAQVLLKVDEGEAGPAWTDEQAAAAYEVHATTVGAIRRRLCRVDVHQLLPILVF
jgi:hypothetical protein